MASRRVFMAGGHTTNFLGKGNPNFIWKKHPDFGKKDNPSLREMLTAAVSGTLSATGVSASQIDRTYVGNFAGELFNQQGHLGAALAGVDKDFLYKPSMRIEGACASGGLAIAAACDALQSGSADLVLVVGVEQQTTVGAAEGGQYLARAADFPRQSGIDDFTFPCLLAKRTRAYKEKYSHFDIDDLCPIVAKAYGNGNKNPKAHMHAVKVSVDSAKEGEKNPKFLSNKEYVDYLRLTDCSQVSDGGSCVLLANEEGLKKAGIAIDGGKTAEILACEYGCGNLYEDAADLAQMDTAKAVVDRVYAKTGLTVKDVKIAEVHDCFSIAELLMYEAMGLAKAGEGGNVAKEGKTMLDGELPVNTGGGLISFGHPVGATGVKQIHEIFRQMKGECGDYQVKTKPEHGLSINMGGDDKTIVSMMLRNH